MKKLWIKARRYVLFIFEYLREKARGLDFTLPAASDEVINSDVYNGYCKTPEKHMEKILDSLDVDYTRCGFIDIGCGKGAVLRVARKFPFQKIAGIDIDADLIKIARRNMQILKYPEIQCIAGNALEFRQYGDFDVFFFFNPFSREILEQVVAAILESQEKRPRKIWVIYHHPLYFQVMENAGLHREAVLHDKLKDYETYIYSSR